MRTATLRVAKKVGRTILANPAPRIPETLDEELVSIRHKRALLERLITFTRHVHQLAGSFDALKEISKPSQRPNKKYLRVLLDAMESFEEVETHILQEQLREIDQRIQQRLQGIIALSMMRESDFLKLFEAKGDSEATYTKINGELKSFEDLLQKNLAMRYVLDKRGAMTKCTRLPISQEDIRGHADRLKKEEAACKKRVEEKIQSLIGDTERLLETPHIPPDLQAQMENIRSNLTHKLETLSNTDNIEKAMAALQDFDLDAPFHEQMEKAKGHKKKKSAPEPKKEAQPSNKPAEKVTGIKAFVRWLNTPWGVSYDDVTKKDKPS